MRKVILPALVFTIVMVFTSFHEACASQRIVLGEFFTNTG